MPDLHWSVRSSLGVLGAMAAGGSVLYVESTRMPGKGKLEITGQLGEVMNESARAALAYLRSHADEIGIAPGFLDDTDLHIHVPAGGVPKDGPSAGVTMFTALASLLSGRRVRPDTAMTGEATLRGRVLPVGGIKSKVLAAHRAGITRVILPKKNERDMDDVPKEVQSSMELIFAEDMSQVIAAALEAATRAHGADAFGVCLVNLADRDGRRLAVALPEASPHGPDPATLAEQRPRAHWCRSAPLAVLGRVVAAVLGAEMGAAVEAAAAAGGVPVVLVVAREAAVGAFERPGRAS